MVKILTCSDRMCLKDRNLILTMEEKKKIILNTIINVPYPDVYSKIPSKLQGQSKINKIFITTGNLSHLILQHNFTEKVKI